MDSNRYKQRSAKFSSSQDARMVRALTNRVDRKAQREQGRSGRRNLNISDVLDDSNLSFQSVPEKKPDPKKTYEEMQDELYQQLIHYKNDKMKKTEKEKRHRQPVFQTGSFTPDKPKFLVGIDSDNFAFNKSENTKTTPFKFLRSTTRSGNTPGGSSASKTLKFRSGATPDMASKENPNADSSKSSGAARKRILAENASLNISSSYTSKEKIRKLGSMRPSFKQSNKSRAQIRMDAFTKAQMRLETAEELGVTALPSSPAISEAAMDNSKQFDSRKSFAPNDFKFGFKGLVAQIKAKAMGIMEDTENMAVKDVPIKENIYKDYKLFSKKTEFVTKEKDECIEETCSNEETKVNPINDLEIPSEEYNVVKEKESEAKRKADGYNISKENEFIEAETSESEIEEENETTSESKSDNPLSKIQESDEEDINPNFKNYIKQGEADNGVITNEIEPALSSEIDHSKYENEEHKIEENYVNEIEPVFSYETDTTKNENEENDVNVFVPHEVTDVCEDSFEMMEVDDYSSNVNTPCHNNVMKILSAHKSRRSSFSSCKKSMSCTPSQRRSTHVKSCNTGSPMTRLRPRTPCSRSTRCSLSAHTDLPLNISLTPGRRSSARKSIRRSLAVSLKTEERASASPIRLNTNINSSERKGKPKENIIVLSTTAEESDVHKQANKQTSSKSKNTPVNNENKTDTLQYATPSGDITGSVSRHKVVGRVSWMVECSPYITTSRGSSNRENRRVSRINSDLTGLFDDIPTDGSPLPDYLMKASPVTTDAVEPPISDANICTNLLSLLQPTSPEKCVTPDVDVWGEDTPTDTPADTPWKLPQTENATKTVSADIINVLHSYTVEKKIDSPIYQKNNSGLSTQKLGRRKSRRSVMFAVGSTNKENCGIRFPGTPIKNTTRVSMGLFSAVDVNTTDPNISPSQNFMEFESPKSERKNRGKRNSPMRMSLLPVVETPFGGGQTGGRRRSQITEDLITWDSPETKKRMSNGAALATPRRSRRFSKAIVE